MSAYRGDFDETKYLFFFIKDDELLEKNNENWKVWNNIKNEFDGEPVYYEKYLKMKLTSHKGEIITNFYNNKIPKEGSQSICLSVVSINFFLD